MTVYQIDPLQDLRWPLFLARHSRATVFHTPAWLEALRLTYGYEPFVLTTTPYGCDLQNGLVVCRVDSWLTGKRLVSLPFADHCEPLVDDAADWRALVSALEQNVREEKVRYAEVRSLPASADGVSPFCLKETYCLNRLDLTPDVNVLSSQCHKDSTQRKIRRAEREGVCYEEGRSACLLDAFYRLLLVTRRRHHIPPQPVAWFRNLIDCFGEELTIHLASITGRPIAAILTLRYKDTLVYKYGCSDARFSNLGGNQLLFWRAIQAAKHEGLRTLDLGRSDPENVGLITFKDRWGSKRFPLTYYRLYPAGRRAPNNVLAVARKQTSVATWVLSHLPDRILTAAGNLLYKHTG